MKTWNFNRKFNQTSFLLERQQQGSRDNSCCIASHTFIMSHLTYQNKTFKTLIEKNDKSSRFKNFRRFRGFALYYESLESEESWENFVILVDKRLDYFLTELELISNLQTPEENWIRSAFYLTDNSRLHVIQELIDIDLFLLHCLSDIDY